jgi:hypothetical protein
MEEIMGKEVIYILYKYSDKGKSKVSLTPIQALEALRVVRG